MMGNRIEVDNEGNVTCIIEDVAVQLETEALIAENADLRRERDFYFKQVSDNGERAHRAIDALNAENDALREFVRDARRNCRERSDIDCYGCALHADGACMAYVIAERLGVDA